MTLRASTLGAGFFYRQPVSISYAGAPATPDEGNRERFIGKQLLTFLSGGLVLGLLSGCGNSDWPATTHFTHPVRIKGRDVRVLTEAQPEASAIASLSSADSVDNVGRLNDQWSQVQLRDGREGFVSNQFLEGVAYVPPIASSPTTASTDTSYTAPDTYAAPVAGYAAWSTARRSRRFRRPRYNCRPSRLAAAYRVLTPAAPPSRPSKAPTYTATYSTAGSSSYRHTSSSSPGYRTGSTSSYRPTYAAPRVNYTFHSSSRLMKRRR